MPRKIKICGMREPENIRQVLALQPDFMGLLFYPASPRYVQEPAKLQAIFKRPRSYALTGVFVNEDLDKLLEIVRTLDLDFVQLHGNENPSYCQQLKTAGINIIKAFPIAEPADFEQLHQFEKIASYFLFDTKTAQKGGSGHKFSWELLSDYHGATDFLLAGGIGPDDIIAIKHPGFLGVDLNSRFEDQPGVKNIDKLNKFITQYRYE